MVQRSRGRAGRAALCAGQVGAHGVGREQGSQECRNPRSAGIPGVQKSQQCRNPRSAGLVDTLAMGPGIGQAAAKCS